MASESDKADDKAHDFMVGGIAIFAIVLGLAAACWYCYRAWHPRMVAASLFELSPRTAKKLKCGQWAHSNSDEPGEVQRDCTLELMFYVFQFRQRRWDGHSELLLIPSSVRWHPRKSRITIATVTGFTVWALGLLFFCRWAIRRRVCARPVRPENFIRP